MRSRLLFVLVALFAAALLLGACAPAAELAPTEGETTPAEVQTAYPAPGENTEIYIPITGSEDTEAYPGSEGAAALPGSGDAEAYPASETPASAPEIGAGNPYPGPGANHPMTDLSPEDFVKFEDSQPQTGDSKRTPGAVYIENVVTVTNPEDTPLSKEIATITGPGLLLSGYLPTPCHQLRVTVSEADQNGKIDIAVYSLVDPEVMCIQVLEPFVTFIPLSDLDAGQYTLTVNGEQTVEVAIPEK